MPLVAGMRRSFDCSDRKNSPIWSDEPDLLAPYLANFRSVSEEGQE
jgi:hypothetical protein